MVIRQNYDYFTVRILHKVLSSVFKFFVVSREKSIPFFFFFLELSLINWCVNKERLESKKKKRNEGSISCILRSCLHEKKVPNRSLRDTLFFLFSEFSNQLILMHDSLPTICLQEYRERASSTSEMIVKQTVGESRILNLKANSLKFDAWTYPPLLFFASSNAYPNSPLSLST